MALGTHTALSYSIPPTHRSAVLPRVRPAAKPAPTWTLLRIDALYLVVASVGAFAANALGADFGGVGFGEAHELGLVAGILLWMASSRRCWHLSAAAVHALLATANIAHWETLATGNETVAIATTAVHAALVALQLHAAVRAR